MKREKMIKNPFFYPLALRETCLPEALAEAGDWGEGDTQIIPSSKPSPRKGEGI